MSLKRSQIKEILSKAGVSAENMDTAIEEIITGHNATVDALKDDIADLKANSQNYTDMKTKFDAQTQELTNVKTQLAEMENYKGKYETVKADYDKYKSDVDGKEKKAQSDTAFKKWLISQGYSETGAGKIVKYGGYAPEFDKDGNIKNADKLSESVKGEWGEYHGTTRVEGAKTATPPQNTGGKSITKEEIMNIKNTAERQKKIAENPELFGLPKRE